mgnify:CR=1
MKALILALLMALPGAAQAQEKPIDRRADIASDQLPEAMAVFQAATTKGIVVGPSGLLNTLDDVGGQVTVPAPPHIEVTLPANFVTLPIPGLTADISLSQKGGRITEQWDIQIRASSSMTEAQWAAYLRSQWPFAMMRIAQRLQDCGCQVMGLKAGADETSIGRIYGPGRALAFRFTRNSTTITVHIDVLAGK